jgi:hypothetical protein
VTPYWVTAFLDQPADVHHVAVEFWVGVTGSSLSAARGDDGEFATLVPPSGDPHLRVQRLGSGPARVHLDLHVPVPREAADRAASLGAAEVADLGYVVMTSPAGVVFCLVTHPASSPAPPASWPGGRSQVDQVCVDAPPSTFDAELAFWEALTGWSRTPTGSPEFERLDGDGQPLRMLLQRLDDDGPAGVHLDLAADDRAAEVARHVALGAVVEGSGDGFTVLVDPAGRRYCVTDRRPRDV